MCYITHNFHYYSFFPVETIPEVAAWVLPTSADARWPFLLALALFWAFLVYFSSPSVSAILLPSASSSGYSVVLSAFLLSHHCQLSSPPQTCGLSTISMETLSWTPAANKNALLQLLLSIRKCARSAEVAARAQTCVCASPEQIKHSSLPHLAEHSHFCVHSEEDIEHVDVEKQRRPRGGARSEERPDLRRFSFQNI